MSLANFLVKLGAGIGAIVIGTLALGLGVLRGSLLLGSFAGSAMVFGVIAVILSASDFQSPDFLHGLIVGAHKKGKWTNALCPSCLWWMKTDYLPRQDSRKIQFWYCVNPNHENTWPEGT